MSVWRNNERKSIGINIKWVEANEGKRREFYGFSEGLIVWMKSLGLMETF